MNPYRNSLAQQVAQMHNAAFPGSSLSQDALVRALHNQTRALAGIEGHMNHQAGGRHPRIARGLHRLAVAGRHERNRKLREKENADRAAFMASREKHEAAAEAYRWNQAAAVVTEKPPRWHAAVRWVRNLFRGWL